MPILTVHSLNERLHPPAAQLVRPARPAQAALPPNTAVLSMSTFSNPDRESFQHLLASAFAVQQSQMSGQLLSALVEVQRLIAKGELDVYGAMHFIVDRARNIANATGVAGCLVKGDQLVYQAGSGSAAPYVGRQVMATLSAPAHSKASSEILRVENAQTDARVEAAICRQFGAKALLILPICHERAVAGVLEIIFSEAHVFQDREVRTYRLMTELIEEAMSHAARLEQKTKTAEPPTTLDAIKQIEPQSEELRDDGGSMASPPNKHATYEYGGAAMAAATKLPMLRLPGVPTTMLLQQPKRAPSHKRRWGVTLATIATVLVLACWIVYSDRRQAWPLGSSTLQRSTTVEQQPPYRPAKAAPAKGTAKLRTAPAPVEGTRLADVTFRRVRVGKSEVDYVGEDVTVRYFTLKPTIHRARVGANEVAYIGEDVTVRYFTPKSRSLSVPVNSVPSEPAK